MITELPVLDTVDASLYRIEDDVEMTTESQVGGKTLNKLLLTAVTFID